MTCLNFENHVQELLDRRQIELPDELAAHAAHCAVCHELWGHLRQLQSATEVWRMPPPTIGLAEVVLQRLADEPQTTAHSQIMTSRPVCAPWAGAVVLVTSAAALLIALGIGLRVSGNAAFANRQPSSTTASVAKRSKTVTTSIPVTDPVTDRQLDVLLHDARDAYLALASQAWLDASTANVLLPPSDAATPFHFDDSATSAPDSLSLPLPPYGRELRDAVESWLQQVFQNQDSST